MNLIESLGLAALHRLDPERAHGLSLRALSAGVVPLAGVVGGPLSGGILAFMDVIEYLADDTGKLSNLPGTRSTLHGALVTQSVQQLADQGAALDQNLAGVRSALMKDVVTKAANAPGDNRLAQAQQLQAIVADTAQLVGVVEQARADNQQKFAQAREMFAKARQDMLAVGQQLRPDQPIKY